MGATCTILVFILTMVYSSYRASILHARSDVEVQASIQKSYYDESFTFGAAEGLNIAVSVFDARNPSTYTMDPTYGSIKF